MNILKSMEDCRARCQKYIRNLLIKELWSLDMKYFLVLDDFYLLLNHKIINTYSMTQPDLYHFETINNDVTSPVKFCMENTSHRQFHRISVL